MQNKTCQPWLLPMSCLVLSSALMFADAQTSAFSRTDISGNDINCGTPGDTKCKVCGDISAIEASCRANPSCAAFTFDNSCGYLKSSGDPRTYREGYTTFLLVGKTPGAAAAPAAAPAPAPAAANTNANPAAPTPAAAAPAASPAAAPSSYPSDTTQVSAPPVSPSASTAAPQAASNSAPSDGGGTQGVFGASPGYGWTLGPGGWGLLGGRRMLHGW